MLHAYMWFCCCCCCIAAAAADPNFSYSSCASSCALYLLAYFLFCFLSFWYNTKNHFKCTQKSSSSWRGKLPFSLINWLIKTDPYRRRCSPCTTFFRCFETLFSIFRFLIAGFYCRSSNIIGIALFVCVTWIKETTTKKYESTFWVSLIRVLTKSLNLQLVQFFVFSCLFFSCLSKEMKWVH